jgi:S-formylglutathione hydrolase FrmB
VIEFSVSSRLLDRSLDEVVVLPARLSARPPLLVLLHGRGSSTSQWLSDELFAELARLGPRAPAVLVVAGGDHSYYHDRKDGPWGAYVLREAIPAGLKAAQADPGRVAIGGISMGGFGALDLARIAPRRFCAVGGHSPALWNSGGETPSGAFDNAEDFARHDVIGDARAGRQFGLGPVWLDAGESDPFLQATNELGRLLHVRVRVSAGGHDRGYWRRHVAEYLRFYAGALARCGA